MLSCRVRLLRRLVIVVILVVHLVVKPPELLVLRLVARLAVQRRVLLRVARLVHFLERSSCRWDSNRWDHSRRWDNSNNISNSMVLVSRIQQTFGSIVV